MFHNFPFNCKYLARRSADHCSRHQRSSSTSAIRSQSAFGASEGVHSTSITTATEDHRDCRKSPKQWME